MDGKKDILGVWIGQHESSKFWLGVLNDLKSRGVRDVYLFCVDGLNGFREAIAAMYPQAGIQRCIIHQIRSSTRYVSWKDIKTLMVDLKKVYQAVTEEEALQNLMNFKDKWGQQYPSCVKNWENNWDILSTFYAYPPEIRKIIYTTNIIEGLNRQFRRITKNKPSFTNDDSLRKLLYLASKKIVEHWTARCRNWDQVISHLNIMFGDRIVGIISIPKLKLSVNVFETEDEMEAMTHGLAHFKTTSAWSGNIGVCGHNVNFDLTDGYLKNLHTLKIGDTISYKTALGSRTYTVETVAEIAETDWSYLGRTEDDRITMITCISGKPTMRLVVQGVAK